MKSVITKTWYLVLLITTLTLETHWLVGKFIEFRFHSTLDFYLYSIMLIFSVLLYGKILLNSSSLGIMIKIWSISVVTLNLIAIGYFLFYLDEYLIYINNHSVVTKWGSLLIEIIACTILFWGSWRYVSIINKKLENNSN
jgi:hypothetical protein